MNQMMPELDSEVIVTGFVNYHTTFRRLQQRVNKVTEPNDYIFVHPRKTKEGCSPSVGLASAANDGGNPKQTAIINMFLPRAKHAAGATKKVWNCDYIGAGWKEGRREGDDPSREK